jgi:serine/threonine protein phosphatase PrpC
MSLKKFGSGYFLVSAKKQPPPKIQLRKVCFRVMRKIRYIYDSWKGVQKNENQDGVQFIENPEYTLFFIFDGVSTSRNSKEGVQQLIEFCGKNHPIYYSDNDFNLAHIIEDMNLYLLKSKIESGETTCCILYIPHDLSRKIKFTHLGDSRIYSFGNQLNLITHDDTHPVIKNMLTKCLGLDRLAEDDFYQKDIEPAHQKFLLCTDGFYHVMDNFTHEFQDLFLRSGLNLDYIKSEIEKLVRFRNGDDATYIFLETYGE